MGMLKKILLVVCLCIFSLIMPATGNTEITLRFAGQEPMDHVSTVDMKQLAELIAKESDGDIKVKVYPSNQLGDYMLIYEELIRGTIDMAQVSVNTQFDQKLLLNCATFMARSWPEAQQIFRKDGWLYNTLRELHSKHGVVFLGFEAQGMSGLGLTKQPVDPLNPDVKQGLLVRNPPNDLARYSLEALGYTTITLPYSDVYTALQTGVANGWYGGTPVHNWAGFRDVVKHYYQLNLTFEAANYLFSEETWKKLTPEQRKIISDAVDVVSKESFSNAEAMDRRDLERLKGYGVKVYEYSEEELAPLFKKGREVAWPKIKGIFGEQLYNEWVEEMKLD
jgi:TRAP-type C4-dicarboxylate transport system substrate-binding protein